MSCVAFQLGHVSYLQISYSNLLRYGHIGISPVLYLSHMHVAPFDVLLCGCIADTVYDCLEGGCQYCLLFNGYADMH